MDTHELKNAIAWLLGQIDCNGELRNKLLIKHITHNCIMYDVLYSTHIKQAFFCVVKFFSSASKNVIHICPKANAFLISVPTLLLQILFSFSDSQLLTLILDSLPR